MPLKEVKTGEEADEECLAFVSTNGYYVELLEGETGGVLQNKIRYNKAWIFYVYYNCLRLWIHRRFYRVYSLGVK